MIKMCLNLFGSKYESIKEVEYLMFNQWYTVSEAEIIEMKDDRDKIEATIELIEQTRYIDDLGI